MNQSSNDATVRRARCEPNRATNPRIFGSVLRGQDHEGSDIDLLVDALPGATLFDLGGLQEELQSLLGLRVDVLTPGDLPVNFRSRVLAEAHGSAELQVIAGAGHRLRHDPRAIAMLLGWLDRQRSNMPN